MIVKDSVLNKTKIVYCDFDYASSKSEFLR